MTATVANTSRPPVPTRLAFGAFALALAFTLPTSSHASVAADFEVDFSSAVIVDKGGLEDAANFPEQTLSLEYLGVTGNMRHAVIRDLWLPDTDGAAHERYIFDFETSPGVFEDSIDLALDWDLISGHAVSEIVTLRTSFVSVGESLASANYDFFLTTDETGAAFGDDPLPQFCGTNLINVAVTGLPFSQGDGGEVVLVAIACPVGTPGHMDDYATSVTMTATVPEPGSGLLGLAALGALGALTRSRRMVSAA
jgi:hypothetical protein